MFVGRVLGEVVVEGGCRYDCQPLHNLKAEVRKSGLGMDLWYLRSALEFAHPDLA
jgi:hypothetical protein